MKTIIIAAISLLVIHVNQDMNIAYWIALVTFFVCAFRMAYKLDSFNLNKKPYGRNEH